MDVITGAARRVGAVAEADGAAAVPGYTGSRADLQARLAKVEGQVRGVARMMDEDRYCIDVLTQISAVTKALQQVALGLLDELMRHCVMDAARSCPDSGEAKLDEITPRAAPPGANLTLRRGEP